MAAYVEDGEAGVTPYEALHREDFFPAAPARAYALADDACGVVSGAGSS